ncbi:MAG TPA: DUF131 domain-containing protein [Candidatus Bathyarchaeia archaeon]|nr:DUF131 domain-containing protein [Candidatus Bathyarchaeia archaeon]
MKLITVGFLIVLIGMLVILAGVFSMAYQSWKTGGVERPEAGVRGGGIVMIGPIPIIFGTDVGALKIVMILAIVLMIIAAILFFLPLRMV